VKAEIKFNGISSLDLDLILVSFEPQPPAPNIIKTPVPYMNGSYDFSKLYGEQTYSERKIPCKLLFNTKSRNALYAKYTQVLEWLLGSGKANLEYNNEIGMYYTARVETPPTWDMAKNKGTFDFEFIAYPFKLSTALQGINQLWDTFNFETDIVQQSGFTVAGTSTVSVYNTGSVKVVPSIICTAAMVVIKSGVTYNFPVGTTKNFGFMLAKGLNSLTITGTGAITFEFHKEVF